jgi:hypothetical protein
MRQVPHVARLSTTALPDLRKGMFDDHAVEKYKNDNPRKYLTGEEGHVAGEPIFELQRVMELFRYLPDKTANGVFGPKTETAVKTFQADAQKLLRVDKSSSKLVQATSVRYQGVVDGVVEQRVRDEIAVWKQENFLRHLPIS